MVSTVARKSRIALIVAFCLIAYLVSLAVTVVRARRDAEASVCLSYRMKLEFSKSEWSFEHNKTTNDVPAWADLLGRKGLPQHIPICPNGGTYSIGDLNQLAKCSVHGPAPPPTPTQAPADIPSPVQ